MVLPTYRSDSREVKRAAGKVKLISQTAVDAQMIFAGRCVRDQLNAIVRICQFNIAFSTSSAAEKLWITWEAFMSVADARHAYIWMPKHKTFLVSADTTAISSRGGQINEGSRTLNNRLKSYLNQVGLDVQCPDRQTSDKSRCVIFALSLQLLRLSDVWSSICRSVIFFLFLYCMK